MASFSDAKIDTFVSLSELKSKFEATTSSPSSSSSTGTANAAATAAGNTTTTTCLLRNKAVKYVPNGTAAKAAVTAAAATVGWSSSSSSSYVPTSFVQQRQQQLMQRKSCDNLTQLLMPSVQQQLTSLSSTSVNDDSHVDSLSPQSSSSSPPPLSLSTMSTLPTPPYQQHVVTPSTIVSPPRFRNQHSQQQHARTHPHARNTMPAQSSHKRTSQQQQQQQSQLASESVSAASRLASKTKSGGSGANHRRPLSVCAKDKTSHSVSTNAQHQQSGGDARRARSQLVEVKSHTDKCNLTIRKMRRGNRRSKSLPSKFNIDALLDYLNCCLMLNKHEVKRLQHQYNNAVSLSFNTAAAVAAAANSNNSSSGAGGGSAGATTMYDGSSMCSVAPLPPPSQYPRYCATHYPRQYQHNTHYQHNAFHFNTNHHQHQHHHHVNTHSSSGYNSCSDHHSSSACSANNSTSSTSARLATAGNGMTIHFNRLSLNHLPSNLFSNQCTCEQQQQQQTPSATLAPKAHARVTSSPAVGHASRDETSSRAALLPTFRKNGALLSSASTSSASTSSSSLQDDDDDVCKVDDDDDDEYDDIDEDDEDEYDEEEEEEEEEDVNEHANEEYKVNDDELVSARSLTSTNNIITATTLSTQATSQTARRDGLSHSYSQHTVVKMEAKRVRSYTNLSRMQPLQYYSTEEFVIKEKLGEGFFANVKKIVSKRTNEHMVLKELKINMLQYAATTSTTSSSSSPPPPSGASDDTDTQVTSGTTSQLELLANYNEFNTAYKSFLKEAQVLRNLSHPNVVRLVGIMCTKEQPLSLILEYVGGGTLKDIIHNINNVLPWKLRVSFAKDIAAAVAYLHSLNIIHRDLKSDNCLVRENGRSVVVADFGLSRIITTNNNSSSGNANNTAADNKKKPPPAYLALKSSTNASGNAASNVKSTPTTNRDSFAFIKYQNDQLAKQSSEGKQQTPTSNTNTNTSTNSFIVAAKRKLKRRGDQTHARKHRYAVVGNSFSMAPEMLKHQMYDQRVDIFSFGIICCEIIGRVQADPDYLPRTADFGLNVELFRKKYCEADCPKHFIKIAIACCELLPEKRPPFTQTHLWLETILAHLNSNNPIPRNWPVGLK